MTHAYQQFCRFILNLYQGLIYIWSGYLWKLNAYFSTGDGIDIHCNSGMGSLLQLLLQSNVSQLEVIFEPVDGGIQQPSPIFDPFYPPVLHTYHPTTELQP
jgi:hypothetical protein